jgi:ABC-2 type transport system ATP-binding protein
VNRRLPLALSLVLVVALAGPPAGANEAHSSYHDRVTGHDGTQLAVTVYRPAGASPDNPVPMILHSHGWGGSRTSAAGAFRAELDRGYGVLSFDQRGFGQTGGRAGVQNPDNEGRDVISIIDYVAGLDWVAKDTTTTSASPGRAPAQARAARTTTAVDPDNPVVFAMGGSYGGGYQLVGALTEVRETGATRFNGLAPEITWYDLPESLAPQGVARSAWLAVLYAGGANAHEDDVHVAFQYGMATGQWPDGSIPGVPNLDAKFHRNGPVAFVEEGLQLDVPTLIGQGSNDNLFNLNEGWKNFERTLTDEARERSIFIGYNGGHALPNVAPIGYPFDFQLGSSSSACTPDGFGAMRLDFFDAIRAGDNPRELVGGHPYSLMTADGDCVQTDSLEHHTTMTAGVDAQVTTGTATTTGAGAPQHLELAQGPLTVAGVPLLTADVSTIGADQRVFLALSAGPNPAQARVIHNNMMPLRELLPVVQAERTVELPGMAADIPGGQNLYLTISPVSDMSFGHGSVRTPGVTTLENIRVEVPVLER